MTTEEVDQYEDIESLNEEVSDGSFTVSDEAEFPIINAEGTKKAGSYMLPNGRGELVEWDCTIDYDTRTYTLESIAGQEVSDL